MPTYNAKDPKQGHSDLNDLQNQQSLYANLKKQTYPLSSHKTLLKDSSV